MSLKLTLAALALGLAAATNCCSYEPDGCNCAAEPKAGCFSTGEEPFSVPKEGSGGFRPSVEKKYCDPADYLEEFPGGEGVPCPKDTMENNPTMAAPDGVTTFCCGGKFFDISDKLGDSGCELFNLAPCFTKCAFNWCPDNDDAPFNREENPDFNPPPPNPGNDPALPVDKDKTICVPKEPEFPCDDELDVCTLGDASNCPLPGQKCCPTSSSRRRRLNFYPSIGCCQEACE